MAMASIANCHKLPVYPMIIPFFTIVNPLLNQEKSPFLVVKPPFSIGCSSPFLQCEAPKIAKLVYNSNNYGLWYLYITIVTGANLNQLITGGAHCIGCSLCHSHYQWPSAVGHQTGAVRRRLRGEFVSDSAIQHVGLNQRSGHWWYHWGNNGFTMVNNGSSMVNIWFIYG